MIKNYNIPIKVLPKILEYRLFRDFNYPKPLPIFLTLKLTNKCNSKCKTCNIWKVYQKNPEKLKEELKLGEYEKIFKNFHKLFWVSITGGEPFLREDIKDIIISLIQNTKPYFVSIATNGILTNKIYSYIKQLLKKTTNIYFIVNLSLDGIRDNYKKTRGINGFYNVVNTFNKLKKINSDRLTIGINTTISVYNIKEIPIISEFIRNKLKTDHYITEIAQKKVELFNSNLKIIPKNYKNVIKFLIQDLENRDSDNFSIKIIKNLRYRFYKSLFANKFSNKCFAGFANVEIIPNGEVLACGVKKYLLGNLREVNYDFNKIWLSNKAEKIRNRIKKGCNCTLASAFYINTLCNLKI